MTLELPKNGHPTHRNIGDLTNETLASQGKLLGKDRGPTQPLNVGLEQHTHTWDLLIFGKDGSVGVACTGPIQSLPLVLQILHAAGANPKHNVVSPLLSKVTP